MFVCGNGQDKKSAEEVFVVGEAFISSLSWEKLGLRVSSQSPFANELKLLFLDF